MAPRFLSAPVLLLLGCAPALSDEPDSAPAFEVVKTEAEWRTELTDEEYRILREKGTERAFTGDFWDNHDHGVYTCGGCGQVLFASDTKFESGSGWPSYYQPATDESVVIDTDVSYGMVRSEVLCGRCGGHLGHVFRDGPAPTGLRYCINGNALDFERTAVAEPAMAPAEPVLEGKKRRSH